MLVKAYFFSRYLLITVTKRDQVHTYKSVVRFLWNFPMPVNILETF